MSGNESIKLGGVAFDATVTQTVDGRWLGQVSDCPGFDVIAAATESECWSLLALELGEFIGVYRKSAHQLRVEKFMRLIAFERRRLGLEASGQELPTSVGLCGREGLALRARLILEECLETISALGMFVSQKERPNGDPIWDDNGDPVLEIEDRGADASLVDAVDGCADIMVVTTGTLSALGVADLALLEMVDQNNLDKFAPGFSVRADGKLVKPSGHVPPDIAGLLGVA